MIRQGRWTLGILTIVPFARKSDSLDNDRPCRYSRLKSDRSTRSRLVRKSEGFPISTWTRPRLQRCRGIRFSYPRNVRAGFRLSRMAHRPSWLASRQRMCYVSKGSPSRYRMNSAQRSKRRSQDLKLLHARPAPRLLKATIWR